MLTEALLDYGEKYVLNWCFHLVTSMSSFFTGLM